MKEIIFFSATPLRINNNRSVDLHFFFNNTSVSLMATSPAPPVVFQIALHHNLGDVKCLLLSCSSVKNGSDRRKIPLGSVSQQTPVIHRQILSQFLCQMPSLTQHCPLFQALFWLYVDLGMMSHSGVKCCDQRHMCLWTDKNPGCLAYRYVERQWTVQASTQLYV